MPEDYISTQVAAEMMQVSDDTLRRWCLEGRIRHYRLPSGLIRFARSDIEAILQPIEPSL
jgi:excisionase family DNA binding protein